MIDHDRNVGTLLDLVDELDIADFTIDDAVEGLEKFLATRGG